VVLDATVGARLVLSSGDNLMGDGVSVAAFLLVVVFLASVVCRPFCRFIGIFAAGFGEALNAKFAAKAAATFGVLSAQADASHHS
jgi:hypothetical protein